MIIVPGSIPKMIFDAFCNVQLIFTNNFLLEQKYQINNQLPAWACALCNIGMEFIPADHSATRPGSAVAADKIKLDAIPVLDSIPAHVFKLGHRIG